MCERHKLRHVASQTNAVYRQHLQDITMALAIWSLSHTPTYARWSQQWLQCCAQSLLAKSAWWCLWRGSSWNSSSIWVASSFTAVPHWWQVWGVAQWHALIWRVIILTTLSMNWVCGCGDHERWDAWELYGGRFRRSLRGYRLDWRRSCLTSAEPGGMWWPTCRPSWMSVAVGEMCTGPSGLAN